MARGMNWNLFEEWSAALPAGLREWSFALLWAVIAVLVALAVHRVIFRVLRRIARGSDSEVDDMIVEQLARPTRYALVALGLVLAAREIPALDEVWQKLAGFIMPALIGWMALAIFHALMSAMTIRADITVDDNQQARRRRTRLAIFGRIGAAVIIFITIGLMLLSIPGVRDIGVTLMASAGLAGLAVGAAAQPALKSLIAGLQMALTEPISIDDAVIIDGDFGRVEDIKTTYVVVRTWDERRLVVPTSRFLEETFQNWTKEGAQLLGIVFLHLDPLAEIAPIREEFMRQVTSHPLWDGRSAKLQVTETAPQSIELRLLMSARDAPTAFDLRCDIREGMLDWLRKTMPDALARQRLATEVTTTAPVQIARLPESSAEPGNTSG